MREWGNLAHPAGPPSSAAQQCRDRLILILILTSSSSCGHLHPAQPAPSVLHRLGVRTLLATRGRLVVLEVGQSTQHEFHAASVHLAITLTLATGTTTATAAAVSDIIIHSAALRHLHHLHNSLLEAHRVITAQTLPAVLHNAHNELHAQGGEARVLMAYDGRLVLVNEQEEEVHQQAMVHYAQVVEVCDYQQQVGACLVADQGVLLLLLLLLRVLPTACTATAHIVTLLQQLEVFERGKECEYMH